VDDPLTATVLALETRTEDGKVADQAMLVSCDMANTPRIVQTRLQARIKGKIKGFEYTKIFVNATHTHQAPSPEEDRVPGIFDVSKLEGVMRPSEYANLLLDRLAAAAVEAWDSRKPSAMSWALGQAVVGYCRRATYFDGHAEMYGETSRADFRSMEGYEDHGLPLLFFWDQDKKLTGIVINIACPSQETEARSTISADFWHEVRDEIHKRYGKRVAVLPQCSAAGDISPHVLWRREAEQVMLQRKGISRRREIAQRIADAVDRVFPLSKQDVKDKLILKHEVVFIDIPPRNPPALPFYKTDSVTPIEFHVLRLGDVAIATNPFELYLDYGVRIQARSKAVLTFVVEHSGGLCAYLPTAKAVEGGSYGGADSAVGPEGGQVLVDRTVEEINKLWQSEKK
jgi:hypothetical protein